MARLERMASAALLVAVVAGACGSGSSSHPSAATGGLQQIVSRPCSVLSDSEIVSALGAPVTHTTPLARGSCTYMLPSALKQAGEVDALVATGRTGADEWRVDQTDPVVSLAGIGDEAWTITNSQYHKIGVRKGALYVFVTVVQDDPDHPDAAVLRQLAQDVLSRVT